MLILAAQNLNNCRFQTNIVCNESVLGKKCSEAIQVASFTPEQVANKEAADAIQARKEKNEVLSDKIQDNFGLHFLKEGVMGLLPRTEEARFTLTSSINGRGWCHNFFQ